LGTVAVVRAGGRHALGGLCVCLLIALRVHGDWAFMAMQGSAAFFGSAAFSLGMTIISDRHESARSFGAAISAQAAYQIAALWAGPLLLHLSGLKGVFLLLAPPASVAVVLTPLLPARGRALPLAAKGGLFRPAMLLAFLGFTVFLVGAGAYWTYVS
jgi:hypothetical protein